MNISQCEKSYYYRQKLCGSWVLTDPVCPQEKIVAVTAELKWHMLVRVIPHVMSCTLPFNKSFMNLISPRMAM